MEEEEEPEQGRKGERSSRTDIDKDIVILVHADAHVGINVPGVTGSDRGCEIGSKFKYSVLQECWRTKREGVGNTVLEGLRK